MGRPPTTDDSYNLRIEGVDETISCRSSRTLLQTLTDAGMAVEANCGGRGVCGKCRLQVIQGQVAGPDNLPAERLPGGDYLACRTYPRSDLSIKLSRTEASVKGSMQQDFSTQEQPLVQKIVVNTEYPTIEQHFSFQTMLERLLGPEISLAGDAALLKQLAAAIQTEASQLTVAVVDKEPVAVEAGDTSSSLFGVAFDIGTTTVAGLLVDVTAQTMIASYSETNPQAAFGADVISRIHAAEKPAGLHTLSAAIRQSLSRIVSQLCADADILPNQIYAATIAGNSVMEHLLLGVSPISLTRSPYANVLKHLKPFQPAEIDLTINPAGRVILLPNIASFVGADTSAAILAANQDITEKPSLLIDLGTNGEIVLGCKEWMFACSTACGPAFEGAHIRDGMRAFTGAIADVVIQQDVQVTTINGAKPRGICGSGVIKAIAELIRQGLVTSTGRFRREAAGNLPPELARRFKSVGGQWEFVLVEAADSASGADISITQPDIRQIQLIKSAICSGIQILMEKAGIKQPVPVFLAGAFGNYVDIESALLIGMIPGVSRQQVGSIGNAAGVGAVQVLLSKEKLERCREIARNVNFVELAVHPEFQKRFLANLTFLR